LPTPQLNGTVANAASPIAYEWIELKALAQSNLSASQLKNTYGIEVGDYKEVDGVKYVLVDLGNAYDGFVFMYHAGFESKFNLEYSSNGGYVGYIEDEKLQPSEAKRVVDALYNNLSTTDEDLYNAIKQVTITCNSGKYAADGSTTYGTSVYTTTVGMFLASTQEMGFNKTGYKYSKEGVCFDLFNCEDAEIARAIFIKTLSPSTSQFWLRTVVSDHYYHAYKAICLSSDIRAILNQNGVVGEYPIVPCFVIG
jgi:hypothetical protein